MRACVCACLCVCTRYNLYATYTSINYTYYPLLLLLIDNLFTDQRTTYDDYSPLGILKTSWLTKHTEELPALVGFFFDLDWEDALWDERQLECVSKIEVIRWGQCVCGGGGSDSVKRIIYKCAHS